MTETAKAGWYRQGDRARYWDGAAWTDQYRPIPTPAATAPPPPSVGDTIQPEAEQTPGRARTAAMVMIGGAAAVAVGCFLPWIKATAPFVGTITKTGVDNGGDGVFALGLAGALAVVAFVSRTGKPAWPKIIGAAVLIGLLVALVGYEVNDISSRFADIKADSDLISTSYGSGLILMGAGIAVAAVGWLQMLSTTSGRRTPAP